jgi:phosphotransferase family enzyme
VSEPSSDTVSWRTRVRAIVLHPRAPRALVLPAAGGPALPRLDLPGRLWSGKPEGFVRGMRDLLGLDVALLREAGRRVDDDESVIHLTLVFVLRDARARIPEHGRWLGAGEAGCPAEAAAVLADAASGRVPVGRAPWRDAAWLAAAEGWMVDSLAALGRPVRGPVDQVRMAELSCVLRAPTDAGDVYFKATAQSPLLTDEGRVMATLSDLFPGYVPAPLATDHQRRWMLLPDLGPEVGWHAPVDVREEVLRAFARLQIGSVEHVDRLLSAGCLDRTHRWLARYATEWLAEVDLSRWLSSEEAAELRAAGPDLASYCAQLSEHPVPCALGHGDMHLGNVARSGDGYAFFDWSDACVMHPFVDMFAIFFDEDASTRARLRDAYLAEWTSFAPPAQLMRAWRLAEPLAALNQVISYVSIASYLEPGQDPDGLGDELAGWARRLIDRHRRPPPTGRSSRRAPARPPGPKIHLDDVGEPQLRPEVGRTRIQPQLAGQPDGRRQAMSTDDEGAAGGRGDPGVPVHGGLEAGRHASARLPSGVPGTVEVRARQ